MSNNREQKVIELLVAGGLIHKDKIEQALNIIASWPKAEEVLQDKFEAFLDSEKTSLGLSDHKTIDRIKWYYQKYFKSENNSGNPAAAQSPLSTQSESGERLSSPSFGLDAAGNSNYDL